MVPHKNHYTITGTHRNPKSLEKNFPSGRVQPIGKIIGNSWDPMGNHGIGRCQVGPSSRGSRAYVFVAKRLESHYFVVVGVLSTARRLRRRKAKMDSESRLGKH